MGGTNGTELRVGVLTPHAAAGPEVELPAMTSGRVTAVVARIRAAGAAEGQAPPSTAAGLRALADPAVLDPAAASFRGAVEAVAYASTTTGYVLGHRAEAALVDRLRSACGVPVVASGSAAVQALRASEARRLTLIHPPWFDDEVDQLGARYFRDQGFEVSPSKATGLPDDSARVRTEHVVDWVMRDVVPDEADAIFFAGNGFRAAGAIDELERRTGLLVLEANQVMLWSILAATRTPWEVTGYGRLFRTAGSAPG